jgi:hypothetical protein
MSRQNKVNPDHYTMAGRLTPDDLARQWQQQREAKVGGGLRQKDKAGPPWMADGGLAGKTQGQSISGEERAAAARRENDDATAEQAPQGKPRRKSAKTTGQRARSAGATRGEKKTARKPLRRKTSAQGAPTGRGRSGKKSGAKATPKTRKAPRARASAARGDSPKRAGRPAMRQGRTKGKGVTRKTSKKR